MASLIHKVFEAITDLEPLSPTATPRTRKHFKETTDSFQQYSNLIHCHLAGIREASGIEPEFEWDEPEEPEESEDSEAEGPGKAKKPTKSKITPASRYEQVMGLVEEDKNPISAQELVQLILDPTSMTLYQAEQAGFVRLFRGYSKADSIDKMTDFLQSCQTEEDFVNLTKRIIDVEAKENPNARLHERESIMGAIDMTNRLSSFVYSVLCSIQAIRFSSEWNSLSGKRGGSEWKLKYRLEAFEVYNAKFLSTEYTPSAYKQELLKFKARHEKVIKARNNLCRLFAQFHSAILLDPTWMPTVSHASSTTGRTPSFPATLKYFLKSMDALEDDVLKENEATFKQLIEALVPESTRKYIFKFLEEYGSKDD